VPAKLLYAFARPALFSLDPESAHNLTLPALRRAAALGLTALLGKTPADPRTVMGISFPNPVGLAAGLDKDGAYIDGLAALGFGSIEVGTVTPRAQAGNPKPRMFRLPAANAIINRMGFNNGGVDAFVANVQASRLNAPPRTTCTACRKSIPTPATSPSIFPRPTPRTCASCKALRNSTPCCRNSSRRSRNWLTNTSATFRSP
jgi:hypothetical protein